MPERVAVITGPTATGKTELGVILARALGGEIVSADSMQVYRGLNIGTAKPAPDQMQGVAHHMIDVADPDENYSVARYVEEASACIEDILSRKRLPIIVGGTGLYIESLISGRSFAEGRSDGKVRAALSREYEAEGGAALLQKLREVDPERAARLSPNDKKRVVRALEVFTLTGRTITEHDAKEASSPPRYDAKKIALNFSDRERLYDRIDRRVDEMVKGGLFDEVRGLVSVGVSPASTAMQAVGYKEIMRSFLGEISPGEAVSLIKRESRRYAKRQMTWLRKDESIHWIIWDETPDFDFARQASTDYLTGSV